MVVVVVGRGRGRGVRVLLLLLVVVVVLVVVVLVVLVLVVVVVAVVSVTSVSRLAIYGSGGRVGIFERIGQPPVPPAKPGGRPNSLSSGQGGGISRP